MRSHAGIAVVVCAFLSACASEPKQTDEEAFLASTKAALMNQQDLEQLYARELKVSIVHPRGSGTVTNYPDGSETMIFNGQSSTGQWDVKDGLRCDAWDAGPQTCKRVYEISDSEYMQFELNGAANSRVTLQE
jgi:hypothetical protein